MTKGFGTATILAALAMSAACTVHRTETPQLTGPSAMATDITLTATPDTLTQDGASQASPVANLPVLFDASTSCAGSTACTSTAGITSFIWDFGDGTPSAGGQRVSHTFTQSGTFNVTLTVTNDRSLSASTTVAVVVGAASL